MRILSTALITCLLSSLAMGGEYEFGNKRLTFIVRDDGHLAGIADRNGTNRDPKLVNFGALFRVTLVKNVYGLDAGGRRAIGLRPIAQKGNVITFAPDKGQLPQFTFKTTDKGAYFVLDLMSVKNPRDEHAACLVMTRVPWAHDWAPLDGRTKKSYRLGDRPHFYGVLKRSRETPLGSIAVWRPDNDGDFNEILYTIWVNENMPRPKVNGPWTVARAKKWVDECRHVCGRFRGQMVIGPRSPEQLVPLADKARELGMNQVYMHLNSWGDRYWPSGQDNFEVNRKVFPGGRKDMVAFGKYLKDKGLGLAYRTVSYALGGQHPEYLGKVPDPRLAYWWKGKLARNVDAGAGEIVVAEGREHPTDYNPRRRFGENYRRDTIQIGDELMTFSGYRNNGDGTWTIHNCKRGFGNTDAVSHRAGESARGLYRIYGIAFAPDPDSTLMEEMAKRFAEFHNDTHAVIANFDALEVHEMMFPYGDQKFMGAVYRHLDHPVAGSTSGEAMSYGFTENWFRWLRPADAPPPEPVPEWKKKVRHRLPHANDMKIGLHKGSRNASSPLAYVWAVPGNAARGRPPCITAQAGFHDISLDILQSHGLVKYYGKVLGQWRRYGPRLPEDVKWRIFKAGYDNGWNNRYCLIDEVFRFEGEGDTLGVVPFRVMKRDGNDRGWTYHQEFGTIYPYQYIRPGDTISLENPYHAQVPEFIVRVMPDFARDVVSLRGKVPVESDERKRFNEMLDKFQGASGVDIKDRPARNIMPCDQQSSPITLKGGRKYYIEARHKDGGGGDNLAVAWAGPGIKRAIIDGKYLSPFGSDKTGSILREWWTDIDGDAVKDLTSHARYPDRPSGTSRPTSFEAPVDWADSYGTRMRGYIHPPTSGAYTFWISSDDASELLLSTDEDPANATRIAHEKDWSLPRHWKSAEEFSYRIMPDPDSKDYHRMIRQRGRTHFAREKGGVRITCNNDTGRQLWHVSGRGDTLPWYPVKTHIGKAGGLGVVVTADGSGAVLVVRTQGQGTRDYLVHLDFKGKRYIEIPTPQASWADYRWPFVNNYKRWQGNAITGIGLGIDKLGPHKSASVLLEDLRFLPEKESALVNPVVKVGDGAIRIRGTVPSDRYLWYRGGNRVGVYDLNWNELEELPVALDNAEAPSGHTDYKFINRNKKGNPWLEIQFIVRDKAMPVGVAGE